MDNFQINKLPKNSLEIIAVIPWAEVQTARNKIVKEAGATLEIKGFRKGKVPENKVAETIGPQKLLEQTLHHLLPDYYQKAIAQNNLKPISNPKIAIVKAVESEDWQIKFTTCEEPEVKLGSYKEDLKKNKAGKAIWTPGKSEGPKTKDENKTKDEQLQDNIDWLIKNVKVEICDLLIDEEVTRRLAGLVDQTQKLGISVDQYLASTGKTADQIKEDYRRQSEENLALEFILAKIAEEEKIEINPEEIDKIISQAKSEEEKKALASQKYYLASLLRRQKSLDFLASL